MLPAPNGVALSELPHLQVVFSSVRRRPLNWVYEELHQGGARGLWPRAGHPKGLLGVPWGLVPRTSGACAEGFPLRKGEGDPRARRIKLR